MPRARRVEQAPQVHCRGDQALQVSLALQVHMAGLRVCLDQQEIPASPAAWEEPVLQEREVRELLDTLVLVVLLELQAFQVPLGQWVLQVSQAHKVPQVLQVIQAVRQDLWVIQVQQDHQ